MVTIVLLLVTLVKSAFKGLLCFSGNIVLLLVTLVKSLVRAAFILYVCNKVEVLD